MRLTGPQIAAAISLVGMTRESLCKEAAIAKNTLIKILNNDTAAYRESTISKIRIILEGRGVEFTENQGVRFQERDIQTLKGVEGFKTFLDNVYKYVKDHEEESTDYEPVCSSSVNDKDFIRHLGDYFKFHINRMNTLKNFKHRILLKERPASLQPQELSHSGYREYRKRSPQDTANVAFYVYGDKLAILMLAEAEPQIVVITSMLVAQAYREIFNALWQMAEPFE